MRQLCNPSTDKGECPDCVLPIEEPHETVFGPRCAACANAIQSAAARLLEICIRHGARKEAHIVAGETRKLLQARLRA